MVLKKQFYPVLIMMVIVLPLLFTSFQGCGNGHSDSNEGELQPECLIVGRFIEYRGPSPSGVYEMDIELVESQDLGEAENPTKDKVGEKITVFTMEYSEAILPNEVIAAYVALYEEDGGISYLFARNLQPAVLEEK